MIYVDLCGFSGFFWIFQNFWTLRIFQDSLVYYMVYMDFPDFSGFFRESWDLKSILIDYIADALDPRVKEFFGRSSDGQHFCVSCGHISTSSSNLRAHVESKHYSPWYKCRFCHKVFKLRNSRAAHEKKHGSNVQNLVPSE